MPCFNTVPATKFHDPGWECSGEGLVVITTVTKGGVEIPVAAPLNMIHRFPEVFFMIGLEGSVDPVVFDTMGKAWYDRSQPSYFAAAKFDNDREHFHAVLEPEEK